jgi:carbamoyl-phosphate synthase large subunit
LRGPLGRAGIPILGTSADAIDLAEDRQRFLELLNRLGLKQPNNGTALDIDTAVAAARGIGYPVILRPSYVLGGRGMIIVTDEGQLKAALKSGELFRISGANPVLIDSFLQHATEVDVDAIADETGNVYIAGIMEHIEEARHSIPAIPPARCRRIRSMRPPSRSWNGRR